MSQLIIALPQAHFLNQDPPSLDFVLLAEGEVVEAGRAVPTQLPRIKDAAHEVVGLAPARALSWHAVQLPPGVGAQSPRLRAVLDGLLEDQLLDAPADLHLVLAGDTRGSTDDSRWVAACERRWLAMAVQGLEAAGCKLSRVLPEWGPPGPARVHVTGTPEHLQLLLCSPQSCAQMDFQAELLDWAAPEGSATRLSTEPELLGALQALSPQPAQALPRSERWAAAAVPRWDLAGFNALAWSQSVQLQSRKEQMRQVLLQTFPQTPPRSGEDPPQQMQREVERLRAATVQPSSADLPVMLSAALTALPAGRAPQALGYAPGQLRLGGLALSPTELQALAERLRPQGYSATAQGPELAIRVAP